jgi:hypothetical protein
VKQGLSFLALLVAFALAARFGWWAVPVVAALWGVMLPRVSSPAGTAALAAASAWGVWLLLDWGPNQTAFGTLAGRLGGVMNLPPVVLILITLLLAALLAWSAAALAGATVQSLAKRSGGT